MGITEMSLPVDIPWKRMGLSKDMIDTKAGDLHFPQRWRSSIATFYHEPTKSPEDYCNRRITYVKVVCTITNFQVDADDSEELAILDELAAQHRTAAGEQPWFWKAFDAKIRPAFPCYGALLQVAVFPRPGLNVPLHNYPYISALQPRKREMYEVVTEAGEITSQSGNSVDVLKGTTSTTSLEDYDLDRGGGGGAGGGISVLGTGLNVQGPTSPTKEEGTIIRNGTENQDLTTRDASREKRESHSYSTNINQLYSLLQSYHLGTNRTLVFMQPRPHTQDQKFTFVGGLRRLEGIQEFFLIIDRPESVPGFCLEVALETAHLSVNRAYQARLIPLHELYQDPSNLEKTAEALGLDAGAEPYRQQYLLLASWIMASPYQRDQVADPEMTWELLGEGDTGFELPWTGPDAPLWDPFMQKLAKGDHPITAADLPQTPHNYWYALRTVALKLVPDIGTEDVALVFEEYEEDTGDVFVTARRLCSCTTPTLQEGGENSKPECETSDESHISTCDTRACVVVEAKVTSGSGMSKVTSGSGMSRIEARAAANNGRGRTASAAGALNGTLNAINEVLWSNLGSARGRHAYGAVSFFEQDWVLDEVSQVLRLLKAAGVSDRPVADLPALHGFVERGLGRRTGARSVLDLGTLSTIDIVRDLEVSEADARKARRDILLAGLQAIDAPSVRPDIPRSNAVAERFRAEFPPERLRRLEDSGRGIDGASRRAARMGTSRRRP